MASSLTKPNATFFSWRELCWASQRHPSFVSEAGARIRRFPSSGHRWMAAFGNGGGHISPRLGQPNKCFAFLRVWRALGKDRAHTRDTKKFFWVCCWVSDHESPISKQSLYAFCYLFEVPKRRSGHRIPTYWTRLVQLCGVRA
jgi:hypothetical protein